MHKQEQACLMKSFGPLNSQQPNRKTRCSELSGQIERLPDAGRANMIKLLYYSFALNLMDRSVAHIKEIIKQHYAYIVRSQSKEVK